MAVPALLRLCYCVCDSDDDSEDYLQPLFDRSSSGSLMPPPKRYGKKKGGVGAKAVAIFGARTDAPRRAPLEDLTSGLANLQVDIRAEAADLERPNKPRRKVEKWLDGVQAQKDTLNLSKDAPLSDDEILSRGTLEEDIVRESLPQKVAEQNETQRGSSGIAATEQSDFEQGYAVSRDSEHDNIGVDPVALELALKSILKTQPDHEPASVIDELEPLRAAYEKDCGNTLEVIGWDELGIDDDTPVVKLSEASFAEVYRIRDSIFKVCRIRTQFDAKSLHASCNAIPIGGLMSEFRIMNSMTVIPGFVSFREAYIIKGKTIEPMTKAVELFNTIYQEASIFEHPDFYTDDSIFLVIELANAGAILDSIQIFNPAMVWDVLIAVIIILARGEAQNEFEHRDLHENNICIAQNPSMIKVDEDPSVKFGQSGRGLYVTLIDYGLSRAKLGEADIAFSDLEDAMFLFHGPPGKPQFNAYRIMRHHLLTGKRTHQTASWHDKHSDESKSWSEFIPYTNVVWIHYLLGVLRDKYQKDGADSENFVEEKRQLNKELRELESRLGTKANGFQNAMETLEYIFEQGWITQEQYENYGIEQ